MSPATTLPQSNEPTNATAQARLTTALRVQRLRRTIESRAITWPQAGDGVKMPHLEGVASGKSDPSGHSSDSDALHVCEALAKANALVETLKGVIEQAAKHHRTTSLPLAIANYGSAEAASQAGTLLWRTLLPHALAQAEDHLRSQGVGSTPRLTEDTSHEIQGRAELALDRFKSQARALSP